MRTGIRLRHAESVLATGMGSGARVRSPRIGICSVAMHDLVTWLDVESGSTTPWTSALSTKSVIRGFIRTP
ncbi:MAG TPA: hypothetical protein VJO33_05005 [Gemmatimonadaceae bacterium]|nr:hypothetical protein [Gemmatimonadaceae bacterium]